MNSSFAIFLVASLGFAGLWPVHGSDLESAFAHPPEQTKPRCYWYWIDGQISREGITRDLEAMKRVGIGEGYIGIIGGGEIKALTEPWWQLIEHAIREGGRIGVDIGLFNCPGWSQSGGPWIKPGQSMRYVALPEMRLQGPAHFEGKLPAPTNAFQDIAVLAFPTPTGESNAAKITARTPTTVMFETAAPFTARSVMVQPIKAVNVAATLEASDDGRQYRMVKHFLIDRHNLGVNVGPVPLAPIVASFPATTARFFFLEFSAKCELGEIRLSPAARVEEFAEKSLTKMFQDPQPPFDFYSWLTPAEPDLPGLIVKADTVRDLSRQMDAEGALRWDVPAGEWVILRAVAVPTGVENAPAPPEATGLEVDKMSRAALRGHFESFVGQLLARIPPQERKAWKHVVADSYEMGPQNWTDDFVADFKSRYRYDPLRFLPVLTGRIVDGAGQSDRFLWDVRRMVADRVARDYVGGLRDLCHEHGLRMWLENYGHWGFPGEFLKYGGSCDEISGEFWADGNLGSIELRDAASAAHIYGMPVVWAEAFTGGPAFRSTPGSLKARGDWALCEGINQFVLHVYIHQPWEDRRPGVNAWFGTEFNRHNTWFEFSKPWIDYQRRCSVMLQAGHPVTDVAYFIGEDAPKMTGLRKPDLPPGYDFDYINADVIENRLGVRDGRFVLPDGTSYKLLVLPQSETMRPGLLEKLGKLVTAGGAVFGPAPKRSPSLQDYPACDDAVQKLAATLWGGKKIMQGAELQPVLDQLQTPPDVICAEKILWKHRREGSMDVYFLSNQEAESRTVTVSFRVKDRAPEFWWPESGRLERTAVYQTGEARVRVPIHFGPSTSVFVVFRRPADADPIVEVTSDGQAVFDWAVAARRAAAEPAGTFTMAAWAKPEAGTTLLPEANAGVHGMAETRNELFPAPHGDTFAPGGTHAGSGIAMGSNGVVVFEHGANYFSPILVYAAPLTNWKHVAVVYRDGQPSLFLNGVLVHTGLKSTHVVHDGLGGSSQFVGSLGGRTSVPYALEAREISRLMSHMPKSGSADAGLPIELSRDTAGNILAHVRRDGHYSWKSASGETHTIEAGNVPTDVELTGPWEVAFDPTMGGPEQPVRFTTLQDWRKRREEGIRYYSGVATYRKTFDLAAISVPLWLDLGEVRSMARLRLNGRDLGILWKEPCRVDLAGAARIGANTLEIEVVNTWLNRLLGDDQPGTARRWTSATTKTWKGPLLPSGLIGPVTLQRVQEFKIIRN